MAAPQDFAPIARSLRGEIIDHYRARGEAIDNDAGLKTLDTNSNLVPRRADLLLELVNRRREEDSIEGLDVVDLGCGFGAMSVYLASLGARVTGVDPNHERIEVGRKVALEFGLEASFSRGWVEALDLPDASSDLIVINNSLCYLTDRSDRRHALANVRRIARPGARLVMRNPSIAAPLDPFTGLPFVHQVPEVMAKPFLKLTPRGRTRSKVRLMSGASARFELRRAGFDQVRLERVPSERRPNRYQHLSARRPEAPEGVGGGT